MPSYDFRALVGFTRSQQPKGIANLLFALAPDVSFQRAWVLDVRKNLGWFIVEKVTFLSGVDMLSS